MQKTLSVIDLGAIRRNALRLRERIGARKFYAVVKADGYGHGGAAVALEIESICDAFCVAIVDEGIALRVAGVSKPILVFAPPIDKYDAERAAYYNLTLSVGDGRSAELSAGCDVEIKINTGMNRYGASGDELSEILGIVPPERICGVYSHLYAPHDKEASSRQLEKFLAAEAEVKKAAPNALSHLAASGGTLLGGDYLLDGVRCGILLYGYAPAGFLRGEFEGAMKVYARRAQRVKFLGGGVGYNVAEKRYSTLTAFRLGYADGFIRGVPLGEGKLCMDAYLSQNGEEWDCVLSDADEYAERAGTISYEVLTAATRRSVRIYKK